MSFKLKVFYGEECDKFYRYTNSSTVISLEVFYLISETPKGFWIAYEWDNSSEYKRWIPKTSKKRFAYPTIKEALESFKARKLSQEKILTRQLNNCKKCLERIKRPLDGYYTIYNSTIRNYSYE